MAQHHPTGSETSPSYAPRSSRFGSEPPSVEDDVDVWCYATVSCLPETTTTQIYELSHTHKLFTAITINSNYFRMIYIKLTFQMCRHVFNRTVNRLNNVHNNANYSSRNSSYLWRNNFYDLIKKAKFANFLLKSSSTVFNTSLDDLFTNGR